MYAEYVMYRSLVSLGMTDDATFCHSERSEESVRSVYRMRINKALSCKEIVVTTHYASGFLHTAISRVMACSTQCSN